MESENKGEGILGKIKGKLSGVEIWLLALGLIPFALMFTFGWPVLTGLALTAAVSSGALATKKIFWDYPLQKIDAKNKTPEQREAQRKKARFNGLALISALAFILAATITFLTMGFSLWICVVAALATPAVMYTTRGMYDQFRNKEAIEYFRLAK